MADDLIPVVAGGADAPPGLVQAVLAYERALVADDLASLAAFFEPGPDTLRSDASGLLVGHDAITAFRGARGGVGPRVVTELRLVHAGDDWLAVSLNAPAGGGRGAVTQLWRLSDDAGWRIVAAHVTSPAPAVDARVWRVVGTPLVSGALTGPLKGRTVAVKDLFAIEGQRIGVGSRAYLKGAPVEPETAPAVRALLDAGADVVGIAQTDQFAYSIAGLNPDYSPAPNPAVPGGVPGGSSSGPASAVSLGHASIGLGTDTAGSIRVPASYQGLWGLRTTHGAVSLRGVMPLAPRYDSVGWLARDGFTLLAAADAGLARRMETALGSRVLVSPGVDAAATRPAREAVAAVIARLADTGVVATTEVALPTPRDMFEAFRITQSAEAWRAHGEWVSSHPGDLAPDIEARFAFARTVTAAQEREGLAQAARFAKEIDAVLGGDVLVLPSAASAAPGIGADPDILTTLREATLGMTAIAGFSGRPALSAPLAMTPGGPVGVCLVGPRGSDLALIEMALSWQQALS